MTNRFMTSDGLQLAWYDLATGSATPPIVLHHGFSASTASEWVESGIVASLAGLGRRVVAIDARGHGASEKPHNESWYGEPRMALDLSELITHLSISSYDLVGYSMGAIVSAFVSVRDTRVRRLVLGGVGEAVVVLGGVDTRALDNRLIAEVLRSTDWSGYPEALRGFRERAEQRGDDPMALAAAAIRAHKGHIPLDAIRAEAIVIAGDVDPLAVRPHVLANALPDARLELVPGDHTSGRLSPEFTAALLDFLR
jgi:pimeloyl-ACP methyl ester carboxylesterase